MNLSEKQLIFRKYLLEKLGYVEDNFLNKYLTVAGVSVDSLNVELQLWTKKEYKFKGQQNNFISATDISNFTYCPVSYAISKTFEVKKNRLAVIGESLHSKCKLLRYIKPSAISTLKPAGNDLDRDVEEGERKKAESPTLESDKFINEETKSFFSEIKGSEVVFTGHKEDNTENRYFISKQGNYVGQPDYIFFSKVENKYFVVEEKFTSGKIDLDDTFLDYKSSSNQQFVFHNNHLNQLRSYLFGINDYPIDHGYLIYWIYEYSYGELDVHKCKILRIEKEDAQKNELIKYFIQLKNAISNKGGVFDIKSRNANKCANCATKSLCGHKTGKYDSYTIPYSINYMHVNDIPFPLELLNLDKAERITDTDNNNWEVKGWIFKFTVHSFKKEMSNVIPIDTSFELHTSPSWVIKNEKLYLNYILIQITKPHRFINLNDLREGASEIFANWVSGQITCWKNKHRIEREKKKYEKVVYTFKKGVVQKTEVHGYIAIYQ